MGPETLPGICHQISSAWPKAIALLGVRAETVCNFTPFAFETLAYACGFVILMRFIIPFFLGKISKSI